MLPNPLIASPSNPTMMAAATQRLSFTIDRSAQGLANARYVIDLSQWPTQVVSWCEGEALYAMPFCGGKKEDDHTTRINKVVTFTPAQLHISTIVEKQADKILRSHQISYQPNHPRVKAKLKSKAANGAILSKANIIADAPIAVVSIESLLLSRLSDTPLKPSDNLHWVEPKRSKRMKYESSANHWRVSQFNPRSNKQVAMFIIDFDDHGKPLKVQAASGKWILALDINPAKTALKPQ